MSSLFTHIFIPLIILIVFSDKLGLSKKMILALSIFAILPDLDMFLFHRATLHNVFIFIIPLIIYIIFKNIKVVGIITYYLFSHILLDVFNHGVFILYPIYNKTLNIVSGISYENSQISFIFNVFSDDKLVNRFFEMAIVSSENVATFILILIPMFFILIKHKSLNTNKEFK